MGRRRDLARRTQGLLAQQANDRVEQRLKQLGKRVLADPAQQQAGDGHAQLRPRDEASRVGLGPLDQSRGAIARRGKLVYPRRARGDQREFSGDEESVGRNEQQNDEETGSGRHCEWSVISGQWSVISGQWSVVSGQW